MQGTAGSGLRSESALWAASRDAFNARARGGSPAALSRSSDPQKDSSHRDGGVVAS